jgi:alkanesulfonate monooxygenase SsuD/methylene tetrahydromethanopterin reductase-like flavin-dependent oxidoreductase (luciferase family)
VRLLRDRGIFAALEPAGVAAAYAYSEAEAARIAEMRKVTFVGTGAQVAERIADLARRLDVQEMAVVTWAHDEAVRRTSYRLIAEAMGPAQISRG